VHIDDPAAEISHVHWLVPIEEETPKESGKNSNGKRIRSSRVDAPPIVVPRRFKMEIIPRNSAYSHNYRVKMEAVLCPIIIRYDAETKEHVMDEEDHRVLTEYLTKYRLGEEPKPEVTRQNKRQQRQAAKKSRQKT
jgi:hypothetical protein